MSFVKITKSANFPISILPFTDSSKFEYAAQVVIPFKASLVKAFSLKNPSMEIPEDFSLQQQSKRCAED